jgi:hypothetical protein
MEGLTSSSKLLLPERSRVTRFFGDRRDVGLQLTKKVGDYFYYQAGLYNGNGQNTTDNDREKDAGLRLEFYPIKPLTIGLVGYSTIGERDGNARDRLEADLRWDDGKLYVQSEFHNGWNGTPGDASRRQARGLHAQAGYTFADHYQPVARIGFLDPNVDEDTLPADSTLNFFEAGFNYMLSGYDARIGGSASYFSQKHGLDSYEVIVQGQVNF